MTAMVIGAVDGPVVRAQVRRGLVPGPEWRAGLRGLCAEARSDHVSAEQFIREFAEAVQILCDACAIPEGDSRAEFSARLVRLCAEEYLDGHGA